METPLAPETISPVAFAKEAGLRYVTDQIPGFTRQKRDNTYQYLDKAGKEITDEKITGRIEALRIPHVWQQVWISPVANSHLQATGTDKRGRKQYRYHAKWQTARNTNKFSKMLDFGKALPALRQQLEHDLVRKQFPREKMLAIVVSLLDRTLIRIGNKFYEKSNKSYGLTTLRNRHVSLGGKEVKISFVGKKNVCQEVTLTDKRLVKLVTKCRELPGHQLFQYYNEDGSKCPVDSEDVNAYLREQTSLDVTAKDFRTWGGSTTALKFLLETPRPETEKEAQKQTVEAVKTVAAKLGNTVAVCRKYYVHPLVLESYVSGQLEPVVEKSARAIQNNQWLQPEEVIFLRLLEAAKPD